MVLDADTVAGMLAAVEGIVGVKKPTIKKFKRELVKLCGKGETFSVSRVDFLAPAWLRAANILVYNKLNIST